MTDATLLMCPLCGEVPKFFKVEGFGPDDWQVYHDCGMKVRTTRENAAEEWNSRVPMRDQINMNATKLLREAQEWIAETHVGEHDTCRTCALLERIDSCLSAPPEGREAVIDECWQAVNAMIKRGPLPGNGCDETAQRNGLILATNVIFALKINRGGTLPVCAQTTGKEQPQEAEAATPTNKEK